MFTTKEVAEQLGVTSAMVCKLIKQGQAHPFRQMGGTWIFTVDELERLRTRPKGKGGRGKKRPENAQ